MAETERTFDFDPAKREKLLRERRIDLKDMAAVFDDPRRREFVDYRFDYGEERRITVGCVSGRFLTVVYTMRGPVTWLITAWPALPIERSANAMSAAETQPFVRLSDGTTLERQPDGSYLPVRSETDWAWLDALSDSEIEQMAASDPDHPALDDEFWASADRQAADLAAGTIKLDRDIFAYFSQQGRSYQERVNAVLRRYVAARRQGSR